MKEHLSVSLAFCSCSNVPFIGKMMLFSVFRVFTVLDHASVQKTLLVLTYRALKCSSGAFRTLNNNAAVKERMTVRQDVCKIRRSSSFRLTERQTGGHTLSSKCEVCQECVRGRERKANKVRRMKIEIFHSQSNHF